MYQCLTFLIDIQIIRFFLFQVQPVWKASCVDQQNLWLTFLLPDSFCSFPTGSAVLCPPWEGFSVGRVRKLPSGNYSLSSICLRPVPKTHLTVISAAGAPLDLDQLEISAVLGLLRKVSHCCGSAPKIRRTALMKLPMKESSRAELVAWHWQMLGPCAPMCPRLPAEKPTPRRPPC